MRFSKIIIAIMCGLLSLVVTAQNSKTKSLQSFMEDRFGMFIHWGPVALRGTEIGWSRGREVPVEAYDNLYKEFNPVLFDADAWVAAAKNAGMKYLTITARHHDGFCLWPTRFTDYNIMQTPFKVDVVGALKKACDKAGIRFCIYYSVLDWYHPDYPIHITKGKVDPKSNMARYVTYMKKQLKELIDLYDPFMFWFDGQWEAPWNDKLGKEIYDYLHALKPEIITNNRLGKEFAAMANKKIDPSKMVGDYDTPEQVVGKLNMEMPWESCFTICKQWAWKPNDQMKSLKECLAILLKTVGGNGNLLLNVGPMPDGRIEQRQIERLAEIGDWLRINGSSVYGTKGGPYTPNDDFATTRKGNKLFVHILNTDTTTIGLLQIPDRKIVKAYRLGGGPVKWEEDKEWIKIPVDKDADIPYTVVLELDKSAITIPVF
ncbi:alpha-L-fucosidase [Niabella insulamsoli]|uniref:alpha-L-fucosidase n=1 Tax=Niabella insulamsoli TaxID=3144874 RepID=UPI0031FC5830